MMNDIADFGMVTSILQSLIFWTFVLALILGLALGPRYLRSRERRRLYDVLQTAYEKGQDVPPELVAKLTEEPAISAPASSGRDADLRRAIVLIAVGLGLAGLGFGLGFGLSFASGTAGAIVGGVIAGSGAIPGFIGVAYLILFFAGRGRTPA
ncbi:MAG TPA: DUF6249 domain-containing protein [Caulobacteraceae bacterium]|nr:DUF6249 domain-containing protein [Caulobacteraceae bacterium]